MKTARQRIQMTLWGEEVVIDTVSPLAERHLGKAGRILPLARSVGQRPIICNASLFDFEARRIWHGDLDTGFQKASLLALSAKLGSLYVTDETGGEFKDEKPSVDLLRERALVIVERGRVLLRRDFASKLRQKTAAPSFNAGKE